MTAPMFDSSFRLRFSSDLDPTLKETEFICRGETRHFTTAAKGWDAQLIAFCLFFVRCRVAWLTCPWKTGDFVQTDREDVCVRTLANSLEKKDPFLECIFRTQNSERKVVEQLFKPVKGDNRSGKSRKDLPRKVRLKRFYLQPRKH